MRRFLFSPAIEVIIFRLRTCCMLGVFLSLVFPRQGHECQDVLSPCDGFMRRPRFTLSSERLGVNGVRTHFNSVENISSIGRLRRESSRTRDAGSCRIASPTYGWLSYSALLLPPLLSLPSRVQQWLTPKVKPKLCSLGYSSPESRDQTCCYSRKTVLYMNI